MIVIVLAFFDDLQNPISYHVKCLEGGASMVKWTARNPCLVLSESDSKLYTSFKFCEEKNHRHLRKHIDLQSQAI